MEEAESETFQEGRNGFSSSDVDASGLVGSAGYELAVGVPSVVTVPVTTTTAPLEARTIDTDNETPPPTLHSDGSRRARGDVVLARQVSRAS